jgi:secreted PhoX family phosphatase
MNRKSKQLKKSADAATINRRSFMGTLAAAAGTTAVAGTLSPFAPSADAETVRFPHRM